MAAIDFLFEILIREHGSDLHLMQGQPPKMRVYGSIRIIPDQPVLTEERIYAMLKEICPPDRWEHYRKNRDLDFAYALGDIARFRANYYCQFQGLGAIFRIIPKEIKSLEDLKTPPVLKTMAEAKRGLILVTGPTGSGKSTTLAAMINHINENFSRKILTIEEPIEFVHPNKKSVIVQREIGIDSPSFQKALYDAMRSDVDVILVGEMRDLETISLAVSAAEKGLLVFGTLHTNCAAKTIDRIVDTFPSNQQKQILSMLAESLYGVCSQLLAKKKEGNGRVAIHEVFIKNLSASNLIREGQTTKLKSEIQTGSQMGMILMDDAIKKLLNEGLISGKEAYMKSFDKAQFEKYAKEEEGEEAFH